MFNKKNCTSMTYYQVNAVMQLPMNKEIKDKVICDNTEQANFIANKLKEKGFKVEVWERKNETNFLYKL